MGEKYRTLDELFTHYGEEGIDAKEFRDSLNKTMGETHVPKNVFNDLNEKFNSYKTEAEQWKAESGKMAELQKNYDALVASSQEKENKYNESISAMKKDFAIESRLANARPNDVRALKAMLNMDGVTYDEQGLHGLDEQVEKLQKENSWLFAKGQKIFTNPSTEHPQDSETMALRKAMGL